MDLFAPRTPTPPVPLDLFPEHPAPALQAPKRAARRAPARIAEPTPISPPSPAASSPDHPEALAQTLEAHPDYRVLRRLQPRLHWPLGAGADVLRMLVLDTETTGLDPHKDRIIELALLRVDVDRATGLPVGDVQVYDGLEDPGVPIPPEVVALTGISDAQVQGQQLDAQRVAELIEGVDLVVAHNAGFDRPFTEKRFAAFSNLAWACSFADIDWKAQGRSSAKLENLALSLGLFYDAHRAEMDCHALLAVLAAPWSNGLASTGLAALIAAAAQPSYALQASQAPFEAKDALKARGYRWNAEQRVWQTHLRSEQALHNELPWLKTHVYGGRSATVRVETLDAQRRFSHRSGLAELHSL